MPPSRYLGVIAAAAALLVAACSQDADPAQDNTVASAQPAAYHDVSTWSPEQRLSGGVQMVPVSTPSGEFHVWTKRVGNNPRIKVLLLHGGPAMTHEYWEGLDSYFPQAGVEYYYYDQLGSFYSDQPKDSSLWNIPRFVEEVEQVRKGLGLDPDNFFIVGNSWGGLLAMEYALKYPQNLKGLVISNMMASIPAYNEYARTVLEPAMDPSVLNEIKRLEATGHTDDPRYMELLVPNHYEKHLIRMPEKEWPDPVKRALAHVNPDIYVPMQGPSELGASGKLEKWDRSADLKDISMPTLVVGAKYDTMDPEYMRWMSTQIPRALFLYAPNGSHLTMYDDQELWMNGVLAFLKDVDAGRF